MYALLTKEIAKFSSQFIETLLKEVIQQTFFSFLFLSQRIRFAHEESRFDTAIIRLNIIVLQVIKRYEINNNKKGFKQSEILSTTCSICIRFITLN